MKTSSINTSIISVSELRSQINKGTVIFDCRFNLMDKTQGAQLYRQSHIPSAYYLDLEKDLSSPVDQHGGRHPLPDITQLEKKLRDAGVNQTTPIVVYDDSRMAYAARAWWLLRYMGHSNIRILDGGFNAWLAQTGSIDKRAPSKKTGNFTANIQLNWIVNRDMILQENNFTLIDSREEKRYKGIEEPIDPIAGHIPQAINAPWQLNTDDKGFMHNVDHIKDNWSSLTTTENLVAYCGSGVTACVNIFSLNSIGIHVKLYPGSWSDWCSYITPADIEYIGTIIEHIEQ